MFTVQTLVQALFWVREQLGKLGTLMAIVVLGKAVNDAGCARQCCKVNVATNTPNRTFSIRGGYADTWKLQRRWEQHKLISITPAPAFEAVPYTVYNLMQHQECQKRDIASNIAQGLHRLQHAVSSLHLWNNHIHVYQQELPAGACSNQTFPLTAGHLGLRNPKLGFCPQHLLQ